MPHSEPAAHSDRSLRINFFRPRSGFMRREVTVIWLALIAWALASIGPPLYLAVTAAAPGAPGITERTLFGMPLHYWFSGHFLIVWFIGICFVFNLLLDWLTKSYRKRH